MSIFYCMQEYFSSSNGTRNIFLRKQNSIWKTSSGKEEKKERKRRGEDIYIFIDISEFSLYMILDFYLFGMIILFIYNLLINKIGFKFILLLDFFYSFCSQLLFSISFWLCLDDLGKFVTKFITTINVFLILVVAVSLQYICSRYQKPPLNNIISLYTQYNKLTTMLSLLCSLVLFTLMINFVFKLD